MSLMLNTSNIGGVNSQPIGYWTYKYTWGSQETRYLQWCRDSLSVLTQSPHTPRYSWQQVSQYCNQNRLNLYLQFTDNYIWHCSSCLYSLYHSFQAGDTQHLCLQLSMSYQTLPPISHSAIPEADPCSSSYNYCCRRASLLLVQGHLQDKVSCQCKVLYYGPVAVWVWKTRDKLTHNTS